MAGFKKISLYRGQSRLTAEADTILTNANQYYHILGVYSDGNALGFTTLVDGKITFNGHDGTAFIMNGVSDLAVDKNCKLSYGLYKNGVLIPGAESPHDFEHANQTILLAINFLITLNKNDYLEVYAKSDIAATTLTVTSLVTTYMGTI